MLVFRGVQVLTQLVGGEPEFGFKAEVGGGTVGAVGGGARTGHRRVWRSGKGVESWKGGCDTNSVRQLACGSFRASFDPLEKAGKRGWNTAWVNRMSNPEIEQENN